MSEKNVNTTSNKITEGRLNDNHADIANQIKDAFIMTVVGAMGYFFVEFGKQLTNMNEKL